MREGSQNGAPIDANTHQKSMPKVVTKRIMKIIKNHISLDGKIIGIHYKTNVFHGLEGCYRTVKGIKKTSNIRPKPIPKSMTHRYKFHARKRIPKT